MTLHPTLRTQIYGAAAAALAIFLGVKIAQGELMWPMLCLVVLGALLVQRLQPRPLLTFVLGLTLVGYIVGNRGFAQLYVAGNFPLLPAEAMLMLGCGILAVQCTWRRELPVRRDPLDLMILIWLVVGGVRLLFDFRVYGFLALRDSATVYYALFYFVAREASREAASRAWLHRVILLSCAVMLVTAACFYQWPEFFTQRLTVRGIPLIFYKADLAGTFLAVGALLYFRESEVRGQIRWVLPSLLLAAGTLATDNRASLLGLAVGAGLLLIGRRWRFAATLGAGGIIAAVVVVLVAAIRGTPWKQTVVYEVYEQAVSITDPLGQRSYTGEGTANKGDNNRFRSVWWGSVIEETVATNPIAGLGFGYDIASNFVQQYYPDLEEEFSTRSPHNILVSMFGRLGLAGLLPFLAILGLMAARSVRAAREDQVAAGLWCGAWVIFVSACFGVVLEGPMGAVLFWTLLGLAESERAKVAIAATEDAARLPAPAPVAETALTP